MEYLSRFMSIALLAVFAENIVMTRALGTSTMLVASKNKSQLFGFGACITFMTTAASFIAYFADTLLGNSAYSYIYMPLLYVMIIGIIYIVTLLFLWKFAQKLFLSVKKYVHISSFNCAVLGAMFLSGKAGSGMIEYLGFGFGSGIGFVLATYLVAVGYQRLNSEEVPEAFRGYPVLLVYIGILSLAFYAVLGHGLTL